MSAGLRIGSLFSGIGGLELGLEWAGVGHTVWQVERDAYCRAVLAKHWPDAERFDDVRTVGKHNLSPVDVICGGFPCQDISYAGLGAGLAGERSGLWHEFARIVGEVGPGFVVVENVTALLRRGMGEVLGTLSDLGYDAEWSTLSACAVGAPHPRDRVFLVASHTDRKRHSPGGAALCDSAGYFPWSTGGDELHLESLGRTYRGFPGHLRVVDGIPSGLDRIRLPPLGNAVVPQVAEVVGRRLLALHAERTR